MEPLARPRSWPHEAAEPLNYIEDLGFPEKAVRRVQEEPRLLFYAIYHRVHRADIRAATYREIFGRPRVVSDVRYDR